MQISIGSILSAAELVELREAMSNLAFADGRATAGWSAMLVKQNQQATPGLAGRLLLDSLTSKLLANPVFQLAARPKKIVGPALSRHGPGDHYGRHVDNAIMDGTRTDLSFTLFLSEPESYEGGELVIETAAGEEAIKLPAGSVIVYPSTTLHRVEPVREGERLAMIGWVRSLVRDAGQRELLYDLDTARRTLFDRDGPSPEFDLVSKCCANLLRMWCED